MTGGATLSYGVLGPTQASRGGEPVTVGTRKHRAMLAALLLHRGAPVSVDLLTELLWGADRPHDVTASLHAYVSGLRRVIEPDRAARARPDVLVTSGAGYALRVGAEQVDAAEFARIVEGVHPRAVAFVRALGLADEDAGRGVDISAAQDVLGALDSALALWRGVPYTELGDASPAEAERARLEDLRLVAIEDRAAAALVLGRDATVAADLAAETARHPLRERTWALYAVALARSERQAAALDALRAVRTTLREELGVDPGAMLARVESAVLRQDLPRAVALIEPPAPPSAPPPAHAAPPDQLPLVGRDGELAALTALVDTTAAGTPAFASLVGEPGIGKTRLAIEVAARAAASGFQVLVGRCAEDDSAPPLWPWTSVLRALAEVVPLEQLTAGQGADAGLVRSLVEADVEPPAVGDDEPSGPSSDRTPGAVTGRRFRLHDAVTRVLLAGAERTPVLVVLEDLHWADHSSLRLLRHLGETVHHGRLLVLATRRARPEPTGVLADVGEVFARRGALRIELARLAPDETARLARSIAQDEVSDDQVAALHTRAEGNPFFVRELLRLDASESGQVPAAVSDVIRRRVGLLPESTRRLLQVAAVVGRRASLPLLAELVQDGDDEAVLDAVAPAEAAGLLVEDGPESFAFGHALTREAVYATLSATVRARWHGRVADALTSAAAADPAVLQDIAHHRVRQGPRAVRAAWQASLEAAGYAQRLSAFDEARVLLVQALELQERDPEAEDRERYELWMARAAAARWEADWDSFDGALREALLVAARLDDTEPLLEAAVAGTEAALWTPQPYGVVDPSRVSALRQTLLALDPGESIARCRATLALAAELHYDPDGRRLREAYAAEALDMARHLGDPVVLGQACRIAAAATWWSGNAVQRVALTSEAVAAAEQASDDAWLTSALVLRASAAYESGDTVRFVADLDRARGLAARLRSPYHQAVLGTLETSWVAMRGDTARGEQLLAETVRLLERTTLPYRELVITSNLIAVRLWQGRAAELVEPLRAAGSGTPIDELVLLVLLRSGELDQAASHLDAQPPRVDVEDFLWFFRLAVTAEAGYLLRRPPLGALAHERLAAYAGHIVSLGSGAGFGPVDAFLALAAAATGDLAAAALHAEDAQRLCDDWGLGPVSGWLAAHRAAGGF